MTPRYPITITPEQVTAHREELAAWVQANGIDPQDIPLHHPILVEKGKGGPVIRYHAYVWDEDGRTQRDPNNRHEVWTMPATAPCTVPPPDLHPSPTGGEE